MTDEANAVVERINALDCYYDEVNDRWIPEPTEAMRRHMVQTPDGWRRTEEATA